jgi:hypothetical protein
MIKLKTLNELIQSGYKLGMDGKYRKYGRYTITKDMLSMLGKVYTPNIHAPSGNVVISAYTFSPDAYVNAGSLDRALVNIKKEIGI